MLVIKVIGISLAVLSCICFGFFKSFSIKSRAKKLSLISNGMIMLNEYIEQSNLELDIALKKAFSKCNFLDFSNDEIIISDKDLTFEDKKFLKDFFADLGKYTKKSECDRIKLYYTDIQKIADIAFSESFQKCKLWQTFGICIGLTLGVLLI